MTKEEAEKAVDAVFIEKLNFDISKLTDQQKEESILNPRYGLMAIDLFVLYMELEKRLGINFSQNDIIDKRFDVYNNIVDSILDNLKG